MSPMATLRGRATTSQVAAARGRLVVWPQRATAHLCQADGEGCCAQSARCEGTRSRVGWFSAKGGGGTPPAPSPPPPAVQGPSVSRRSSPHSRPDEQELRSSPQSELGWLEATAGATSYASWRAIHTGHLVNCASRRGTAYTARPQSAPRDVTPRPPPSLTAPPLLSPGRCRGEFRHHHGGTRWLDLFTDATPPGYQCPFTSPKLPSGPDASD